MAPLTDTSPASETSLQSHRSASFTGLTPPQLPQSNTSTSADHKIIRKRNRLPVSCNFCRQRKLKCNRGHPCENCVKRGDGVACVYLMGNNGNVATSQASNNHLVSGPVFTSASNSGSSRSGNNNGSSSGSRKTTSGSDVRNQLDKLESLVLGLMHSSGGSASEYSQGSPENNNSYKTVDNAVSNGDLASDVDAVRESLGMMKLDRKGKAMYHGETHWVALLNELNEVKSLFEKSGKLDEAKRKASNTTPPCNNASMKTGIWKSGFPFSDNRDVNFSEILDLLPQRELCDKLIDRYFESIDPTLHIIHRPSFENEYCTFWLNPAAVECIWLGMLLCMLALSLQSCRGDGVPEIYRGKEMQTWIGWQKATEACLVTGNFMLRGSIVVIRTLLLWLAVESKRTLVEGFSDRTWVSTGMVVRIAQSMGLHRDPKWFNISPFEAEIRRHMWYTLIAIDTTFAINQGLPVTIRSGEHDVRAPLNLNDCDIYTNMGKLPEARDWNEETDMTYLLCITKLNDVLGRIVSGTFSLRPRAGYETILAHDAEIRATFASFPEYLRTPPEASGLNDPAHILFQRFLLDLHYRKALVVLHRPFAARADVNEKFALSKDECLDASLQMLRRQVWLYNSPDAKTVLEKFRWFTDGIYLNHHFHACMMLCVELYSNMDSMSTFQKQSMRDVLKSSRKIQADIGRFDPVASRRQGLIERLFEQLSEIEMLSPEERKKVSKNMMKQYKFKTVVLDDKPLHDPVLNIDPSRAVFATQSMVVHDTLGDASNHGADLNRQTEHARQGQAVVPGNDGSAFVAKASSNPTLAVVDANELDFLPEEDEIYVDQPERIRRIPDLNWLHEPGTNISSDAGIRGEASSVRPGSQGSTVVPNSSLFTPGMPVSQVTLLDANGGNLAELPNGSTPTVFISGGNDLVLDSNIVLGSGMVMKANSPGTDVPHGRNWDEWDMIMQGMWTHPMAAAAAAAAAAGMHPIDGWQPDFIGNNGNGIRTSNSMPGQYHYHHHHQHHNEPVLGSVGAWPAVPPGPTQDEILADSGLMVMNDDDNGMMDDRVLQMNRINVGHFSM
ncbi:fungal-specific transcription factor domain-containing protein [Lipomyces japonicus]|uniref:fungal-specific transcription factor domain-containing protein n=1 Tax=Lipomyces japonicus TaxID=56871 RepID=UPI0034CE8D98